MPMATSIPTGQQVVGEHEVGTERHQDPDEDALRDEVLRIGETARVGEVQVRIEEIRRLFWEPVCDPCHHPRRLKSVAIVRKLRAGRDGQRIEE